MVNGLSYTIPRTSVPAGTVFDILLFQIPYAFLGIVALTLQNTGRQTWPAVISRVVGDGVVEDEDVGAGVVEEEKVGAGVVDVGSLRSLHPFV